ncbi:MAG: hypothetical protein FWC11_05150 [Firmicutes bacterium]|nr:hypothetical protein [Bacillota bacterium]
MIKLKKLKIVLMIILVSLISVSAFAFVGCNEALEERQLWVPRNFNVDTSSLVLTWTTSQPINGYELIIRDCCDEELLHHIPQGSATRFYLMSLRLPVGTYYVSLRALGGARGNFYYLNSAPTVQRRIVVDRVWCEIEDEYPCQCDDEGNDE